MHPTAGQPKPDLPSYTLDEVLKHGSVKDRIWVTYGQGVYDITDYIDKHPGGDKIMLAAGGSVEPFWMMYGVHKRREILNILEKYRIGKFIYSIYTVLLYALWIEHITHKVYLKTLINFG